MLIVACALRVWSAPTTELHLAGATAAVGEMAVEAPAPAPEVPVTTAVKTGPAPARAAARKKGIRSHGPGHAPEEPTPAVTVPITDEMTAWRRLRWVLLTAVPSSLMLGVTSYVSVDLSPFPLLWIIPLSLYLLSFILVFMPWWTGTVAGQRTTGTDEFSPHRLVMYFLMPLSILALAVILMRGGFDPLVSTFFLMAAFFGVALGCHGEFAKDRPTTRYLTEYYLLMSFGGMLGGVFNAIFAPLAFPAVWEFPIAIVLAALVRPALAELGWIDDWLLSSSPSFQTWAQQPGGGTADRKGTENFSYFMDVALALTVFLLACGLAWWLSSSARLNSVLKFIGVRGSAATYVYPALLFGLPLICCFFFSPRPLRFGLALAGVMVCNQVLFNERGSRDESLYRGRSYFGVLRVLKGTEDTTLGELEYTYLMHGTTYHGRNYRPTKQEPGLARLATTYYHRYGPVGVVMEQYNWFANQRQMTYHADARMPCSQIGQITAAVGGGFGALPYANLVNLWSEPPYATIGLGTGTMASYGRPLQHVVYYEIDEKIRNFSLPTDGSEPYFTYLQGAMKRGCNLEVIMGDARLTLERDAKNTDNAIHPKFGGGQKLVELDRSPVPQSREHYYKVIVVDAFSSDAIPVHLVTRQAIQLYLNKMTDDGVLCVHTSNRHLNLVKPVAKIVQDLNREADENNRNVDEGPKTPRYTVMVGKDRAGEDRASSLGHFSSEYVMIYREDNKNFSKWLEKFETEHQPEGKSAVFWYDPIQTGEVSSSVWTDDYSNLVSVIRWPWPFGRH